MEPIYLQFNKQLYKIQGSLVQSDSYPDGSLSAVGSVISLNSGSSLDPGDLVSGSIAGNLEYTGGFIQSANFVAGTSGWKLDSNGTLTAVNATLSGTITATAGTIGGFTIGASTLTGGTIQTGTSGNRIVMTTIANNNAISIYDSIGLVTEIRTNAGAAIRITPTTNTDNGILITSAVVGNGFYYTNSGNVVNRGLFIEQTSTGASNNLPAIDVRQSGSGEAIYVSVLGSGVGMQIAKTSGTGTANLLKILDTTATNSTTVLVQKSNASGGGALVTLENSGLGKTAIVTSSSNDIVLDISHTATASANPTFQIVKTAVGPIARLVSSVNNASNNFGIEIDVQNAGAGLEYAFDFQGAEKVNAAVGGTQDYKIRVRIGGTTYFIPCYTT